jgi:hypothetical protein
MTNTIHANRHESAILVITKRSHVVHMILHKFSSPVTYRFFQTVLGEFRVDRTALEPRVLEVRGKGFQVPICRYRRVLA